MWSSLLQRGLLRAYAALSSTGVLKTRPAERVFLFLYHQYKQRLEAPYLAALRPFVRAGTTVVDVGANIGFFTLPFMEWVGSDGRVVAIEPEPVNCRRLREAVARSVTAGSAMVVEAVAQESAGTAFLAVDAVHPGNHHLAPEGLPVEAVTVDGMVQTHGRGAVSLIKIDVQGGEERVIRGALGTITRWRPALLVELDEPSLVAQGSSVAALVEQVAAIGYEPHFVEARGARRVSFEDVQRAADGQYVDVLFLHCASPAMGAGRPPHN